MDTVAIVLAGIAAIILFTYVVYKIAARTFLWVIDPLVKWFEGRESGRDNENNR